MKYFPAAVLLALAATLTSSCASSKRMLRVADVGTVAPLEKDRSNAFPLYYRNFDKHSLLWPIVDWDKQGFAIRPLFNQEGDEYSVLFPLAAWNPVNGDGWVLNTYWNDDTKGFFPLYHQNDRGLWLFPYYRHHDKWMVFPVASGSDEHLWILNTYIDYDDGNWLFLPVAGKMEDTNIATLAWWDISGSHANYGLFPLYWHFGSEKHPSDTLFPIFWHRKDDYTVIPLVSHYSDHGAGGEYDFLWFISQWEWDARGIERSHFLPLWYYEREGKQGHTFISPLAYSYHKGDNQHLVTPLWQQFEEGLEKKSSSIFPLWFKWRDPAESGHSLLPLYWYEADQNGYATITPLWQQVDKGPQENSCSIFPLWFKWQDNAAAGHSLLPLYWYEADKNGSTVISPLAGWSSGEDEMFNLLGPLYIQSQNKARDRSYRSVMWPLYVDRTKGERSEITLGGPIFHRESRPGWSDTDILWPLGNYESSENGDYSWRAFPLGGGDEKGSWALGGLYGATFAKDAKGERHSAYRLSPLFAYNDEESGSSDWYECGLIHSRQRELNESADVPTQTFPDTHREPWRTYEEVHQQTVVTDRALLGLLWNAESTQSQEGSSSLFFSFPWWQSSCDYQFHAPEQLSPAVKLFLALDNGRLTLKESEQHLLLFFGAEQKQASQLCVEKAQGLSRQERQALRVHVQELAMQAGEPFFLLEKNRLEKTWWWDNLSADAKLKAKTAALAKLGLAAEASLAQLVTALPVEEVGTDQAGSSFPLLWGYERDNDQHRFDLLGFKLGPLDLRGLLFSHQGDEKVQEASVLRYLYLRRTEGEQIQRNIFPWIVWNTGAKEESRFAFIGDLINIKHDTEGKSSGKFLFFFSWGESAQPQE